MQRDLDFIYIGQPKAGSTWLFEALRGHPECRIFESKSSGYYESPEPGPIAEYHKQLNAFVAGGKIGEISHDTYLYPNLAEKLRRDFPHVKIIICLREPGDFARSMLLWLRTHTTKFGRNADEMTQHPRVRSAMDYLGSLTQFYQQFPAEQIKAVFFDDLKSDPQSFYDEICNFVGISADYEPEVLREVVNPARAPRFAPVTHAIYHGGVVARKLGFGDLVESVKRWPMMNALLYSPHKEIDPAVLETANRLREQTRSVLDPLEKLIGRKLPQRWREA